MFNGADSTVGHLKPAYLIWSDLVDMNANRRRHDRRNFLLQHHTGRVNVRNEIVETLSLLDEIFPKSGLGLKAYA